MLYASEQSDRLNSIAIYFPWENKKLSLNTWIAAVLRQILIFARTARLTSLYINIKKQLHWLAQEEIYSSNERICV